MATRDDFVLSCTVDFPDDAIYGTYTHELLDEMMRRIKSMGATRVYWLYYNDVDPESYWAGNIFSWVQNGPRTVENIGEPLKAAVPHAHAHGLEIYGVLKPYNTGVAGSISEGAPEAVQSELPRIGSANLMQVIPFVERFPHTRVKRRPLDAPAELHTQAVTKIRLVKSDDSPTRIKKENLQIWTSDKNYRYTQKEVDFELTETVEPSRIDVADYYGNVVTRKGDPVRVLTLDGLDLTDRYVAVTTDFPDFDGDFVNTPLAMIEVYGKGSEPLPIVVASLSGNWERPRDLRTGGLEFDNGLGYYPVPLDVGPSDSEVMISHKTNEHGHGRRLFKLDFGGCIAFARGKNEYLPCTPSEVYPEVRKLWAGWIDRMMEAGVDGIDLRISAHGSHVDEPFEYGFNEPILEEYATRYGSDPLKDEDAIEKIAAIRGDHYTDFVRETSEKVRGAGKKMQVHVHTEAFRRDPCQGQIMGFPANVDFQWRRWLTDGLLDGITLRTSWYEAIEDPMDAEPDKSRLSNALEDSVVVEALDLCNELDVPAYLNRYVGRAVRTDEYVSDLEAIYNDERFSGFDVYEFVFHDRANVEGTEIRVHGDTRGRLTAKAKELGLR